VDWRYFHKAAWLGTRAKFVSAIPTQLALLDLDSSEDVRGQLTA